MKYLVLRDPGLNGPARAIQNVMFQDARMPDLETVQAKITSYWDSKPNHNSITTIRVYDISGDSMVEVFVSVAIFRATGWIGCVVDGTSYLEAVAKLPSAYKAYRPENIVWLNGDPS